MRATLPAALLLLLATTSAPQAAPNIVVIMTDDQEDTGSAYMPKTHALLAEKGLTFTNSFVNLPLCAPSRASFLTGHSAHNTGIKANNPKDGTSKNAIAPSCSRFSRSRTSSPQWS